MSALEEENNSFKSEICSCLIHYTGTKGSLVPFTKKRFETFRFRREERLRYDEVASVIAKKSLKVCPEAESSENCGQFFFHPKCYSAFTDVSKLRRAEQKKLAEDDAEKEITKHSEHTGYLNQSDVLVCHSHQNYIHAMIAVQMCFPMFALFVSRRTLISGTRYVS